MVRGYGVDALMNFFIFFFKFRISMHACITSNYNTPNKGKFYLYIIKGLIETYTVPFFFKIAKHTIHVSTSLHFTTNTHSPLIAPKTPPSKILFIFHDILNNLCFLNKPNDLKIKSLSFSLQANLIFTSSTICIICTR